MKVAGSLAVLSILLALSLVACAPETDPVDITRVVEEMVEATRSEEATVQVTRSVEAVAEATDTLRDLFYRYDEIVVTVIVETELQRDLGEALVGALENDVAGVEKINLIRWSEGLLEVELVTAFLAREDQPAVSWDVVNAFARHFAPLTVDQRLDLTGSDRLVLSLITLSATGQHRFRSETDHGSFVQLNDQAMSYDDWTEAAGADFR